MAILPEVRQDLDSGAVAVKLPPGSPLGDYGVMQPGSVEFPLQAGGAFVTADRVADWPVLSPVIDAD